MTIESGGRVKVGVTLPQFTSDRDKFVEGARRAEALGFDSVWLFDHLWPLGGDKTRPVLEGWTSLAWLAAATERIGIGTLVTRSSLRHPGLLASMAATVARIAPGRVTIGVGSGDDLSRGENEAFGLPYFAGSARRDQLDSTVEMLVGYRDGPELSHRDSFASLDSLPSSMPHHYRVWVGGWGETALETAARRADGWNGWGKSARSFGAKVDRLQGLSAGRTLEHSWAGTVYLGAGDSEARAKLGSRSSGDSLVGGPATVAGALSAYVDAGAKHLILSLPDVSDPATVELLAAEVLPRVSFA